MQRDRLKLARPIAKLREGRTDWYSITNNGGTAEIMIYDEIGYVGVTASDFVRDLQGVDASQIMVRLNTPGGEVFDGIAIYNALKQHPANVTMQVDGIAASIGSVIAMAGDQIIMTRNATMMIHEGHGMVIGNAKDMAEMADLLDKTSNNIASIYADRAGGSTEEWRKRMKAETWYSADEAVEAGLADNVYGDSKTSNSWDLSIFNYSGRDNAPTPEEPEPTTFSWNPDEFRRALKEAAQ